MASPSVLTFDAEGRAVDFEVWLDDLQLFLQCDSKDGLSLFDLTSGASTSPAADADSTVRSQWTTRDAAARLAVRSHLPSTKRAHFSQYKSAKTLYDAVVARYSSPATAALSRLMLPYLFPDLAAFATVTDLITHLRTSDTRYRAALLAEDHFLSLCPTTLTVDLLEECLLAAETSITAVGASRGDPRTPFFEGCSPVPFLPSVASAAAVDLVGTESVSAASTPSERRCNGKGKRGKGAGGGGGGGGSGGGGGGGGGRGGGGRGGGFGGSGGGGGGGGGGGWGGGGGGGSSGGGGGQGGAWYAGRQGSGGAGPCAYVLRTGDRTGEQCGGLHATQRCFGRLTDAWHTQFPDATEIPRWGDLLKSGVAIFDLDFDAILAAMYAVSVSAEADCYVGVPPDPGIESATPGAGESALSGTASAQVLHTFTLDSAAPHYLWPFAVQYAAHQINLQPWVSLPETSPTLRWTGKVGDASAFRVWGSRAFVRDLSADKLSSRAVPCVFLGFPPNAPGWQFYHPTSRRVLSSQDVTFDESVPYYHLFPYRAAPLPPPPLFLTPDAVEPVQVAVDSGASRGAEPERAVLGGAGSGGAEPELAELGGAGSGGPSSALYRRELPSPQELREWFARRWSRAVGARGAAGAGGSASAGGAGATGPGGARTGGTGAAGPGGAAGAGATGGARAGGAAGVGAAGAGAPVGAGVGAPGAAGGTTGPGCAAGVGADAGGAGVVPASSRGAARPRPYFVPLLEQVLGLPPSSGPAPSLECPPPVRSESQLQLASPLPAPSPYAGPTGGLAEHREPETRPASPVRTACTSRRVPRQRPPAVPGTHQMALRPSTAPQRVPLPSPPESSLPALADLESDSPRAASPTVTRFLATAVIDPSFVSAAASALVAELFDFAAHCRLDYATSLVAESASVCPPSVGGECALSTDVLEDRQEEFLCFSAALPHLVSMLLAPEGDPDAPDIPTPRSYAEAVEGPYSSQWQAAMDAEMASWNSTGTYVDEVPPPGANIVSGMWIFRVKRPPGSPLVFKARYVARGFSQRQGVDYFHTFSLTPKMTTLRVLLRVAAQRDYELHSLDFSTAFLQGSLHEEIWLRRPPGFTGSFPPGTQWSLRRLVYGLRQAPREWHDTLRNTLAALGFAPSTADPSLFLRTDTLLPPFYILVYVDDLVFATADTAGLAHVKARRTISLTQSHMVQQVLQRLDFTYSSPQATPLSTRHSLSARPSDESVEPSGPYPELVGCLMYPMTCTRPDLAYPLSILARYVAPGRHRPEHMAAAKRVLHYLCSMSGMGLVLGGRSPVVLTGHVNTSWVNDLATQRSSQGYTFSLGSGSVSWQSTRSSSFLSSSYEAEIYAGAMAAQELRWLTYLLTDLGEPPRSPPVLYVDNKAMLALCREHRLEHRTKHIALRYFVSTDLVPLFAILLPPTSRRVLPSQDVTFDKSVPFNHLFPYRSAPPPPPPLFLAPTPPPVDPLPPQGPAPSGVSQVDPLPGPAPVQVAAGSSAARGAASGGAASGCAEPGGSAEPEGVEPGGAESEGAESGGAEPQNAASSGGSAGASLRMSPQQLREWFVQRARLRSGATGARGDGAAGAGGAGVAARAGVTGGTVTIGPGGARTRATGAGCSGAGGAGAGGAGVGGTGAGVARVGGPGVGGAGAGGAGAVDPGGAVRPRLYFVPLLHQVLGTPSSTGLTPPLLCPPPDQTQPPLQLASPLPAPSPYTEQSGGLTERCEPASRPISPVRIARCVPCSLLPPVPGTHAMTLRPFSVPLCVPLLAPPESSLPKVPNPESDRTRAASPTVSHLLATAVTDPLLQSAAASSLVAELLDFAAARRLDYTTALVAESASARPRLRPGCSRHPDPALLRRGDYGVKRPPGSPPVFKARYVA
ncbi:unnamed protein product [Closterium sp. NIES-53]